MASVIRLNSGGSSTMERMGLSLEQAKEVAARLREAGEPPGCAWCVRLDEENEEEASDPPSALRMGMKGRVEPDKMAQC